jgi:drug/metabolite transporter (DMT)-like permease
MFEKIKNNKNFLLIGLTLSMLTWGLSWPSAKMLMQYGKPLEIAIIRFFFTVVSMFFILRFAKIKFTITKQGLPYLVASSLLVGGYSICFFNGIKHGMPGAGGVLVTTMTPLISFLLSVIISKRSLRQKEIIGLALGIFAGFFLLKIWSNYLHLFESGNSFFLLSTVLWSFLSRFTAKSSNYGSPLAFTFWMNVGCIVFLFFLVDLHLVFSILQKGDAHFWTNMIFNSVVNTGMATTFFFYATSKMGAAKTSSFIYIVPFAAAISSFFFVHETVFWNTIVGGLLGISAVWIINKK